MTIGIVLALTVGAAPLQLAATRMTVSGVYNQREETFLELATRELSAQGFEVITPAQATARLGAKKKAELFACKERCPAAFGEALGVQGVLEGSIKRASSGGLQVLLQVLSTDSGLALSTFFEGGVDEYRLTSVVARGARVLAADLSPGDVELLARTPLVHATTTSPMLRKVGWAALALGAVGAGAGAVLFMRRADYLAQPAGDFQSDNHAAIASEVEQLRGLGIFSFCVGGAALVTSVVLLVLGFTPTSVILSVAPGPGGGLTLGAAGHF
jgi:hypothetical protein